jgi:hypothetical protein
MIASLHSFIATTGAARLANGGQKSSPTQEFSAYRWSVPVKGCHPSCLLGLVRAPEARHVSPSDLREAVAAERLGVSVLRPIDVLKRMKP